jgi:hypothetical protein
MSILEFEHDGILAKVDAPPGMEWEKTTLGKWVLPCRCGTYLMELGDRWKEPTHPNPASLLPEQMLTNGKRANELMNAAPTNNLMKWLRTFSQYQKIREHASDEETFIFELVCENCHQVYSCTTTMINPVSIKNPITVREALKSISLKRDGFSLKALARTAIVQKFETPEAYIDNVEKLLADAEKVESYLKKVEDLVTEGKKTFQSGRMGEFLSILESDLSTVPFQLRRELERELDIRVGEMLEASFVAFPEPEESLPERIISKLKPTEAKLIICGKP